jgi:SAM-dependent methyltransferase
LCETFIGSAEFRLKAGKAGKAGDGKYREPLPIFLPRLSVDTLAAPDELCQLWERTRLTWESLGNKRPFYSVLTEDRYLPSRFGDFAANFWQSGEVEALDLVGHIASLGLVQLKDAVVLEFGCGVGRVAIPLAAIARSVVAYDISERHLEIARKRATALGRANMQIMAIGDGLPDFEPCDVFYSRLVLQHNPPPIIGEVTRRLIRSLKRGGVGVFQVPTYCVGYHFSTREALRSPIKLDMDMHCYPQASLFSLIADERTSCAAMTSISFGPAQYTIDSGPFGLDVDERAIWTQLAKTRQDASFRGTRYVLRIACSPTVAPKGIVPLASW